MSQEKKSMRSISLLSIYRAFGNLSIGTAKNKEGKSFVCMSYTDKDNNPQYISMSKKLDDWTEDQVIANRKKLMVGFTTTASGKPYQVCYMPGENSWTSVFSDEDLV